MLGRSIAAGAGTAVGAAVLGVLLFPPAAMAGAFAVMGENLADEATRVGGFLLIIALLFFLPDILRRNFPGLLIGFLAFCLGVFMIVTPNRAIGLAKSINNTVTQGVPGAGSGGGSSGGSGGGSKLPDPGAAGQSGP